MSAFADTSVSRIMPAGFEKIRIGMTWQDCIVIRPSALPFSIGPDDFDHSKAMGHNKPPKTMMEYLNTGAFEMMTMSFSTNHCLTAIGFIARERKDHIGRIAQTAKVFQLCGTPVSIKIHEYSEASKQIKIAELLWRASSIHVKFGVGINGISDYGIYLQIMERSYANRLNGLQTDVPGSGKRDATHDEVEHVLAMLKQEIKAAIDGNNTGQKNDAWPLPASKPVR